MSSVLAKPRGPIDAPIVFVGDAPNEDDIRDRLAWSGPVEELIEELLVRAGIDPASVLYMNAISYGKPTFTYKFNAEELKADAAEYLLPTIAMYPRKLIVAFGNNALCALGISPKPERVLSNRMKLLESADCADRGITCPMICSMHPWGILREPEESGVLVADLELAKKLLDDPKRNLRSQAPMKIIDLESPEMVDEMVAAAKRTGQVAYDYETTGLDREVDFPITVSFCPGEVNDDGKTIVYWWAGYDRLKPRFDEKTMEQFKEKFHCFFKEAGKDYDLIAWNGNFDDWMSMSWLKDYELPGSQFDAMLMKWQCFNGGTHGLKAATALYLGYPNYDEEVDRAVKEVKGRRARILQNEDDFFVLDYFGHKPKPAKTGQRWPDKVDKGLAAYAMIPYDTLRLYGCYDSLYTLRLKEYFGRIIEKDDLSYACDLRHRIRMMLLRTMQRGMLVDVDTAEQFRKEFMEIEEICKEKISEALVYMGFDIPDFNPNSGQQLIKILFGEPINVPVFMPGTIVNKDLCYEVAADYCRVVEEAIYGEDDALIIKVLNDGTGFDYDNAKRSLRAEFVRRYPNITPPRINFVSKYLNGPHRPIAFTKTGLPSVGLAILESINDANPSEFLSLVLMLRRASKLRGTFIDAVLNLRDKNDILRASYNTIGTTSGRISSSNPNGQNFVKTLRGLLIPRPGYRFVEFDMSQAELRVVAALSDDKALKEALMSSDIHRHTASLIFKIPEPDITPEQRKAAKAQPLYAKIPTPSGWKTMGDLRVGDSVFSVMGKPCTVTGVFPQGEKRIYEVVFQDGIVVECAGDHLWTVMDQTFCPPRERLLTTLDMLGEMAEHEEYRYAVERTKPVEFVPSTAELPIGPYTMGVLIGSGALCGPALSVIDPEIADKVHEECINNKYIPDIYKRASVHDRWELLRGLMDTGGTVTTSSYMSTSKQLACDVAELVRSLGGSAHICTELYYGCDPYYRVEVIVSECPFSLVRRAARWVSTKTTCTPIVDVRETDRTTEMQCIMVDDPAHEYLTEGYIPTHNTINFGILYGMSKWRLSVAIGVTPDQAQDFIDGYFRVYPDMKRWLDKQIMLAKRKPYYVYTPWGTRRSTLNMRSVDKVVIGHTERIAGNMPVQGAAGELTLLFICEIMDKVKALGYDVHMVNTTHDSCTLETPNDLVWEEDGEPKGPVVDIINEVVGNTAILPYPLNTIQYKVDLEVNDYWSCKPDIKKSLDPKQSSYFRWDLIKPEEVLDAEEAKELEELDATMAEVTNV